MAGRFVAQSQEAFDEEQRMYGHGAMTEEELDEKYPNRPHNHSTTLPFHSLFLDLFNPLNENKKKPTGPVASRRKQGPHGQSHMTPNEIRRNIVDRFISKWRQQVGNDIYPAFRLIIPEKDRDRAMYGLKEKAIGKLLVRILRIDKDSEDGFNLLNWRLPGQNPGAAMAGDFAGRCFDVISKRPILTKPGNMTIGEVNERLDTLSASSKDEDQLPIFQEFYQRMNAEEMMWLIRVILRQMKVGATERTIFDIWHPDAESLFNVSSSLRRVCWELHDPSIRLDGGGAAITLMQCFQPQLAAFQMYSLEKMVQRMKPTEEDDEFWVEEKLDGERMQLHMVEDESVPGGKRFRFWSRKAKEYTYLYGNGFEDDNSALTRHLKDAFHDGVRNIILDGEMITWDMEQDATVPFGTLKTAALSEQKNPFSTGRRPLYKIFDCLYLNDEPLTQYTLRDRRKALAASIHSIHRRFEIHSYSSAHTPSEIEPLLRKVVAEASEGLVIKNPRSSYRLNQRNDDWIKVKPEYMTEFGEELDCVIIGGYWGSGNRGGKLSSFMCGLRVDQAQIEQGANPMKCFSFFKVGGGMTANDYAAIRHATGDKWQTWDAARPPTEFIELAGGEERQFEKPDVWIKPCDSVVVSVKAASVGTTEQFRMGLTLRFPRFKKLRDDKTWKEALSIQDFMTLKANAEREHAAKEFKIDEARRVKRQRTSKKRPMTIAGVDDDAASTSNTTTLSDPKAAGHPSTAAAAVPNVFAGLTFYIMTESVSPKKSKAELEALVKAHGGALVHSPAAAAHVLCIADRRLVPVASLVKKNDRSVIRPAWLLDCVAQATSDAATRPGGAPAADAPFLLPYEGNRHLFHATDEDAVRAEESVDEWGDAFARDVGSVEELKAIMDGMPDRAEAVVKEEEGGRERKRRIRGAPAAAFDVDAFLEQAEDEHRVRLLGGDVAAARGWLFRGCRVWFDDGHEDEDEHDHDHDQDHDTGGDEVDGKDANDEQAARRMRLYLAKQLVRFAGGSVAESGALQLASDFDVTHVVVGAASANNKDRLGEIRRTLADRMESGNSSRVPRVVGVEWVEESWKERTLVDEEMFVAR
ncbi:dna ligase 4 [Diplodia corticola]|uniref:DNA ligase n=1 Tax=Diplodia corticola TaxID=236234 RepID=A0A1J9RPR1_9PEZI|nr:dna ligase 4 [Diplodia corticola]OJD30447.1 dna ligase 4 [Diplodia corticola]